ncbi:MAG: MFS transporter [Deinococcus sp.]|nr:MFS transporter [Deinococcus sp.]MCL5964181.1 MFS transporter [Deinococcus sp.]
MRPQTSSWYLALSSYWFASSFKWFLVLLVLLPARVSQLVPETEKAGKLGLLFGIGAVMALLGPPLFGYLSDRVGRRLPYLASGAVLTALALVWLAYAPSYGQLLVAYLLLQLADDLSTGPYSALIPDLVPRKKRGEASGWMGALQVTAQVFAGIVGFAVGRLDIQFLIIALLTLLAAAFTLWGVREAPNYPTNHKSLAESLAAPWKNPDFRWVWATRFLVMLAQYMVQTYLQYYLADVVKTFQAFGSKLASEPFQAVALLGLFISLGAAISSLPAGWLSDTRGRKPVIYLAGTGLGLLMLPIILIPRYDVLIALAVLFGIFFGAYLAVDWALVSDVLPDPESHATDMGLWQTAIVLPQVLAGSLGGVLDRVNQQTPNLGYTALFIAAGFFFVMGSLLVSRVRGSR